MSVRLLKDHVHSNNCIY